MVDGVAEVVGRRGRPRRFDDETERRLLLDAAMELLRTRGYLDFGVADILEAAELSTRSFYRHFESKEALHVALLRREIASVVRHLTRVVDAADDPVAGIEAWIDAFLDTFFDPRLASRSEAFSTPAAISISPITEEMDLIRKQLCQPLAAALRRGHESGSLRSPDPDEDARSVYGLLTAAAAPADGHDRASARAQVIRFAWPALGLEIER
jgi:AcrR family transcriptional regulator